MTPQQVDRLARQVQRAWYADGIVEMTYGALACLMALFATWRGSLAAAEPVATALRYLTPVLILAAVLAARRVALALKKRLMAGRPLAVYDVWSEERRSRALWVATAAFVAAVLWGTVSVSRGAGASESVAAWTPLFLGMGIGVPFLCLGHRLALLRFHVLAVTSGLAGAVAGARAPGGGTVSAGVVYLLAMGIALLASGACHLTRFLGRSSGERRLNGG